ENGVGIDRNKVYVVLKSEAPADYKKGYLRRVLAECNKLVKIADEAIDEILREEENEELFLMTIPFQVWAYSIRSFYTGIAESMFPEDFKKEFDRNVKITPTPRRGPRVKQEPLKENFKGNEKDFEQILAEIKQKAQEFNYFEQPTRAAKGIVALLKQHFYRVSVKDAWRELFDEDEPGGTVTSEYNKAAKFWPSKNALKK
ncbi:MAG: hypothetical protein HUK12_02320, partial [Muribaculaceae bacterium]|nr:hypothetical protein [Muribaculaceae bacterium]